MDGYSVYLEARAPGDETGRDFEGTVIDEFAHLLEPLSGVLAGNQGNWSVQASVYADDPFEAVTHVSGKVLAQAAKAGVPLWPIVRIEAVREDLLDEAEGRPPDVAQGGP
jgi:hypothetical protein